CSCGEVLVKIAVSIFSGIILLIGAIWLSFGIYLLVTAVQTGAAIPTASFVFIIVLGIVVITIALVGLIGAWKRNKCMLLTFATFAGIMFVAHVVAAVVVFVNAKQFVSVVSEAIREQIVALQNPQTENKDEITEILDELQKRFECCGGFSSTEWPTVPASCCASGIAGCSDPYPVGCGQATFEALKVVFSVAGFTAILLCIFELSAV
uniref:Tetraspanin n=1 Tax=Mesocestoides corti TaxID=53468 RepID=A0A5K3FKB3_MESCO